MRARCSRLLPFLAVFAIVLAAAPVCAQYVEVPPFTVGTAAADYDLGSTADVAGGADGNFVSVWNETVTTDPTAPLLRAVVSRRSTPLGTVGPIRRWERSLDLLIQPAIAAVAGGYFEFWIQHDREPGIWGHRLDTSGALVGGEFEVTDERDPEWLGREVAVAEVGLGALVFWFERTGLTQQVFARLYDADGQPRTPAFSVWGSADQPYLDAVPLGDGGFLLGWGGGVGGATGLGRSYLANGAPRDDSDAFLFSNLTAFRRLAVTADGTTVAMVGVRPSSGGEAYEIWARRFAIDGTPLENDFLVHRASPGVFLTPDAEFDLAGNLYVTWSESGVGVRARGFDANRVPLGPAVTISSDLTPGVRTSRLRDGRFATVWSDMDQDRVCAAVVSLCTPGTSVCGDGTLDPRCELCDDGAANSDVVADACRTTCRPAACGDGVIDGAEACDDGDTDSCDGCSASCEIELGVGCGDGVANPACGEPCDDGNASAGDGCSPTCALERIRGGGSISSDCYAEWSVGNPTNEPLLEKGEFRRVQVCSDGDPRCDFDLTAGICAFHLRTCANNTDVAGCTPGNRLSSWSLRTPNAAQAAKRADVGAARAALLGTVPSSIVGPSARDVCSPVMSIPVAVRGTHAGKLSLKTLAIQYDGARDSDTLKLVCLPATP